MGLVLGISGCGSNSTNTSNHINNGISTVTNVESAYHISPNGSDSNSGASPSSPWKTLAYAIPKLNPGDALVLMDGTYTKSTTGLPDINCGSGGNAQNGTATQPITIIALNERQAFLQADGSVAAFLMQNCSYWNVEGLHGESADLLAANGGQGYSVFEFDNDHNINIRRLLAAHPNRYANTHTILIASSDHVLVEESETYYYHRYGILAIQSDRITVRRSYANSRNTSDATGCGSTAPANPGCPSIYTSTGDAGISGYSTANTGKTSHVLFENNITENNATGIGYGYNPNDGVPSQILGSITLNNYQGLITGAGENNDNLINFVTINNSNVGVYARGQVNFNVTNATIYNGASIGVQADFVANAYNPNFTGSTSSLYLTNDLIFNNAGTGISISQTPTWLSNYTNSYNTGTDYSLSKTTNDQSGDIQNSLTIAPTLMGLGANQCIVYVPGGNRGANPKIGGNSSNMAGAGQGGVDIGANIIYRYENGILTDQKLWDQTTGQFPCGAVVSGVNDIAGSSCIDVNQRLNVGVNGCPIP